MNLKGVSIFSLENIIMHEENPKGSIDKLLELISEFSKVSLIFPYASNKRLNDEFFKCHLQ